MARSSIRPFMLVFNTDGIDQKSGVFMSNSRAADWIENMHTHQLGSFSANQQGYSMVLTNVGPGEAIDGLCAFQSMDGIDNYLVASNGDISLFDLTGQIRQTIATGLGTGLPIDFEAFQGTLYVTQKTTAPLKWTGFGGMAPVSGFPITISTLSYDKPRLVERHVNRLVYADFHGSVSYPSHLAISDHLSPESFTLGLDDDNGAVVQISPGDGQSITGMKSLHLPSSNKTVLLVFKENSVYVVNGDTPLTFSVELVNATIGALNNRCIVQLGNDIIFMDRHRISSLSSANESGTLRFKPLSSDRIQLLLQDLNLYAAEKCFAVHMPFRQEIWFGIPTGSSTEVDKILVYHYPLADGESAAWSIRTGLDVSVPLVTPNDRVLMGTPTSNVVELFTSSTYNGEPIPWRYRFPYCHFDSPLQSKRVVECFAWFLNPSPMDVSFRCEWRGGGAHTVTELTKTVQPHHGSIYGSSVPPAGVYGQNFFNDIPLTKVRIPIRGNGEQLRLELSGHTNASGGPIFLGFTGLVELMNDSRSYL